MSVVKTKKPPVKVGDIFGKLTVKSFHERRKQHRVWNCLCQCGKETQVYSCNLLSGHTTSCGCELKRFCKKAFSTHNQSKTRLYGIWKKMKDRCENSTVAAFKNYGGRGIKVCEEWRRFENFYADMSADYKDSLTLERIDPNKGYEKENCKWIPAKEQARNKTLSRNNKTGFNGISYSKRKNNFSASWSDEFGREKSKCFSVRKYGYFMALALAISKRVSEIQRLRQFGIIYSEFHGSKKEGVCDYN